MRRTLLLLGIFLLGGGLLFAQGVPPPAGQGIDWLQSIVDETNKLVQNQGDILMPIAELELAMIGIWQLCMLVIKRGMASINEYHYMSSELVSDAIWLLLQVVVIQVALNFYNNPIPGTNISLHQIPSEYGRVVAGIFDQQIVSDFMNYVNYTVKHVQKPSSIVDILGFFIYVEVLIQMGFLDVTMFVLNSVSYFFVGMLVVFGPPMLPLFLTKHFSRWLFNWIDMIWGLSMLRATSAAATYLWAGMLMTFFQKSVNGDYSIARFTLLLPIMLMLNFSFLYGIFKLPSFTERLFGGGGGMAEGMYNDAKSFVFAATARL
jgi:hypothetical protein